MYDPIIKEDILKILNKKLDINVFESIDSTNDYLKQRTVDLIDGMTVIANSQTSGRGRMNREFYSPKDTGIYMSIYISCEKNINNTSFATAFVALAVCKAIKKCCNISPQIKWVNDILINSKKVCGILSEGVFDNNTNKLRGIIFGIGINVYEPLNGFPNSLIDIAGAIVHKKEYGLRNHLIGTIINEVTNWDKAIEEIEFINEYKKLNLTIGREIEIISIDGKQDALAVDIDNQCRLIVKYSNGNVSCVNSGEVKIKHK